MQSDKQQNANSYLYAVMKDSIKPFRYRSRVRLLLGIPDDEYRNFVLSPTMPSAEFRYAIRAFMNETYTKPYIPNEAVRFASHNELEINRKDSHGNHQNDTIQKAKCDEPLVVPIGKKDAVRQADSILKLIHETTPIEKIEKSENRSKSGEITKINIPGVSEKSLYFYTLLHSNEASIPVNKVKERAQHKVHFSDTKKDFVRENVIETRENEYTTNFTINAVSDSERLQKKETAQKRFFANPPAPVDNIMSDKNRIIRGKEKPLIRNNPFSQKETTTPIRSEDHGKLNPYQTLSAFKHTHFDIVYKANKGSSDRIEQLRSAVYELTSKISSKQEKANNETQLPQKEQTPPPPVQPVVIIKRYSNQTRTPCAFWERSYLGRFSLRTLR